MVESAGALVSSAVGFSLSKLVVHGHVPEDLPLRYANGQGQADPHEILRRTELAQVIFSCTVGLSAALSILFHVPFPASPAASEPTCVALLLASSGRRRGRAEFFALRSVPPAWAVIGTF